MTKENILNALQTTMTRHFSKPRIDYYSWVFSSSYNTKFNYNSKYLFQYAKQNLSGLVKVYYVMNDEKERAKLEEQYGDCIISTATKEGINRVLQSGVWFTSAGLPVYDIGLTKNYIIINLWHGIPLKKIALKEQGLSAFTRLYFKYVFSDNYRYVLTTSEKMVDVMAESFGVEKEKVKVWGQPRNDVLFLNEEIARKKLMQWIPTLGRDSKLVLYAPTFRDYGETVLFPFPDFEFEKLHKFLVEKDMYLLIRFHQSEEGTQNKIEEGERIRFLNEDKIEDIMEVLNGMDLLITDYSSLYIDYLLTEKPILFVPYDYAQYERERGMNFAYDRYAPGPKIEDFKQFLEEILQLIKDSHYYQDERVYCNHFFNSIQSPCSELICKNVLMECREREGDNIK